MTLPKRVIGIDFGLKRIGLSISDERQIIAMPLSTFQAEKNSEKTAQHLMTYIQKHASENKYEIEELVIGLPLMMNGTTGFLADEVNHFAQLLKHIFNLPIHLWDERLSTVQAERALREGSFTRKKRSKMVDRVSAIIILQSYLDRKNHN